MEAVNPPSQLVDALRDVILNCDYSKVTSSAVPPDEIESLVAIIQSEIEGDEEKFINDVSLDAGLIKQFISGGGVNLDASTMLAAMDEVSNTYNTIKKYRDEYDLYESYSRPSHTLSFIKVLEGSPEVDCVLNEVSMHNGKSFLVSMIGGEQYEIQVIPAGLGKCYTTDKIVEKYIAKENTRPLFEAMDIDHIRKLAGI